MPTGHEVSAARSCTSCPLRRRVVVRFTRAAWHGWPEEAELSRAPDPSRRRRAAPPSRSLAQCLLSAGPAGQRSDGTQVQLPCRSRCQDSDPHCALDARARAALSSLLRRSWRRQALARLRISFQSSARPRKRSGVISRHDASSSSAMPVGRLLSRFPSGCSSDIPASLATSAPLGDTQRAGPLALWLSRSTAWVSWPLLTIIPPMSPMPPMPPMLAPGLFGVARRRPPRS